MTRRKKIILLNLLFPIIVRLLPIILAWRGLPFLQKLVSFKNRVFLRPSEVILNYINCYLLLLYNLYQNGSHNSLCFLFPESLYFLKYLFCWKYCSFNNTLSCFLQIVFYHMISTGISFTIWHSYRNIVLPSLPTFFPLSQLHTLSFEDK